MKLSEQACLSPPIIAHTKDALFREMITWKQKKETCAFVPTMGFLHHAHLQLMDQARRLADRVVVSIFVNPTQFGPHEDWETYPRNIPQDLERLQGYADLVYIPDVEDLYPPGFSTSVHLTGPATVGLEDRLRPTHFSGVATVVIKLLLRVMPTYLILGEKDFQQLRVIYQLIEDLDLPVTLIPGQIGREPDGLACSSRNVRLTSEERQKAPELYTTLQACVQRIRKGQNLQDTLSHARQDLEDKGWSVDYLEARDYFTLESLSPNTPFSHIRLLVAARLGSVRLIDNCSIEEPKNHDLFG